MKEIISVVAPAYNEEDVINKFYDRMTEVMKELTNYDYELVIVNDGSKDKTASLAYELCEKDQRVSFVNLSRNYGHEVAVAAGIDHAKGDVVVLMDIDLQDTPEFIYQMIEKYEEGYDVINARRASRAGETFMKKITAKFFYKLLSFASGKVKIPRDVGNYRMVSRKVVEAFKQFSETHRFARGLFSWAGFKTIEIEFERDPRVAGETKYNYKSMINFAIEGLTSFTTAPLRWATYAGAISVMVSIGYAIYILVLAFTGNPTLEPGWASLMLVILFFGSVQLLFLGVIGEYLGRVFNETKNRPLYFVMDYVTNINKKKDQ